MADPCFQQWELSTLDQFMTHNMWEEQLHQTDSYGLYPSASISSNTRGNDSSIDSSHTESYPGDPRQQKMARTTLPPRASSPSILSFGNPGSPEESYEELFRMTAVNPEEGSKRSYDAVTSAKGTKKAGVSTWRSSSLNQDHVLAERKRRERLSQKFIALSAMIPGLKKMDKASVLGDAIRYLKTLQDKVKSLEEQAARKRSVGSTSALVLNKSQTIIDESDTRNPSYESSSPDELDGDGDGDGQSTPEIEVKLSDKTVLIRMYCDGRKGILSRALCELEKLQLAVLSMSAIPFAASSVDITIIAQIEEGFTMSVKDLARKLSSAF